MGSFTCRGLEEEEENSKGMWIWHKSNAQMVQKANQKRGICNVVLRSDKTDRRGMMI